MPKKKEFEQRNSWLLTKFTLNEFSEMLTFSNTFQFPKTDSQTKGKKSSSEYVSKN